MCGSCEINWEGRQRLRDGDGLIKGWAAVRILRRRKRWLRSREECGVLSAQDLEGAGQWLLQGGMEPQHL